MEMEAANKLLGSILSVLPRSPFRDFIDRIEVAEWIQAVNWLIPVGNFVAIGTAWLGAIGVFYVYQIILRWAKAVGD